MKQNVLILTVNNIFYDKVSEKEWQRGQWGWEDGRRQQGRQGGEGRQMKAVRERPQSTQGCESAASRRLQNILCLPPLCLAAPSLFHHWHPGPSFQQNTASSSTHQGAKGT